MDTSIKIPKENLIKINELKLELIKKNIKITQKDIIDGALKFSLNNENFIKIIGLRKKRFENEKELFNKWLNSKVVIRGDIIKEHDEIL